METCGFAHFEVNGEFRGVFNDLENIDQYFLSDHGLNPNGKLFEAKMSPLSNFQILPDYSVAWDDDSKNDDEGYGTLAQLIQTINVTPDEQFASTISSVLNVNSYLDYYSSLMLAADFDHTEHNFEMNLNPDSLVWEVIAKDFDANFLQVSLPITYGTSANPEKFYNSYNILTDRLLKVPLFRQWYANKLAERLQSDFTTGVLGPFIDQSHAAIEEDGSRDVFKRGREDNTLFESSPATLKQFITQRRSAVLSQLPGISPGLTQPIELNEVLAANVNGLTDPFGEHDSWLEIYNPSAVSYDLSGSYLTNNPTVKTMWPFPSGTIVPAGGYLLVWLDNQPSQGPYHANFTVSALGQALALYGPVAFGNPLIDTIAFGPQSADVSFGRRFSGSWLWATQSLPTPRGANLSASAPRVSE